MKLLRTLEFISFALGALACRALQAEEPVDQWRLEAALSAKYVADATFAQGDLCTARRNYVIVDQQLEGLEGPIGGYPASWPDMLRSDSRYRQSLLDNGLGFWGLAVNASVAIPARQNQLLQSEFQKLKSAVASVNTLIGEANQANVEDLKTLQENVKTEVDAAQSDIDSRKAQLNKRFYTSEIEILERRVDEISARRHEIAQQSAQLNNSLASLENATTNMLMQAVAQAAGVPANVDIAALASGKDLDKQLVGIGTEMLGDPNSSLSQALADLNAKGAEAANLYRQTRELAAQAKDVTDTAQSLGRLAKQGTFDSVLQAGQLIYDKYPDAAVKEKWRAEALKHIPPELLLASAQANDELRKNLASQFAQLPDASSVVESIGSKLLQQQPDNYAGWLGALTSKAGVGETLGELQAVALLELAMRQWGDSVVRQLLRGDVLGDYRDYYCSESEDLLYQRIGELGRRAFKSVHLTNGVLEIDANRAKVHVTLEDLRNIAARETPLALKLDQRELLPDPKAMFASLKQISNTTLQNAVTTLPGDSFANSRILPLIEQAASGKERAITSVGMQSVLDKLSSHEKEALLDRAAAFEAGVTFLRQHEPAKATGGPSGATPPVAVPSKSDQIAQQALSMALNAALPGAGVLVGVLNNMNQMSQLIDQMNALADEERTLMAETYRLTDLLTTQRLAAEVARLDYEAAEASYRGAVQRSQVGALILRTEAATANQNVQAARDLLPAIFYRADLLRYYYDKLDRSLALWIGDPTRMSGTLDDQAKESNEWRRHAIDDGIRIAEWLDRSLEGTRDDLNRLVNYWDRQLAIIDAVCASGCAEAAPHLGKVNQTKVMSLRRILGSRWTQFESWQRSTNNTPFEISFFMTPEIAFTEGDVNQRYENVRIIDAFFEGRDRNAVVPLASSDLMHSGSAYVRFRGRYYLDSLTFASTSGTTIPPLIDLTAYADRWGPGWLLRPLEGYGFLTPYMFRVPRTADTTRLTDIVLQIVYHYTDVPPEAASAARAETSSLNEQAIAGYSSPLGFDLHLADLGMLGIDAQRPECSSIACCAAGEAP